MINILTHVAKVRNLALVGLLTGCSAITALNEVTVPLEVYELRAPASIERTTQRQIQRDVVIELPTTSGALSTDRIMIRPNALQAQYLPDARWSDPTPVMVQTLMLRAVEATGAVRYVARKPLSSSGDFAVLAELVDFQAELNEANQTTTAQVSLIVRVVREADARIVASKTFSATAPSLSTENDAIIAAFDTASSKLFSDFAVWLPSKLGN